jgi:uncharacterized phiE125 gp8 family phage protein
MIPHEDTAPAALALDWETEVKSQLRLDTDDERARVEAILIPTVTEWIQALTNRQLITATWLFWYPSFGCAVNRYGLIPVPRPPLQSVAWIKYYDAQDVLQTWDAANYTVTKPRGPKAKPGWIRPVSSTVSYPSAYGRPDAVEIKAVCGYGATYASVPPGIRQAMLLLLGELFERREETVVGSIIQDVPHGARSLGLPFLVEI